MRLDGGPELQFLLTQWVVSPNLGLDFLLSSWTDRLTSPWDHSPRSISGLEVCVQCFAHWSPLRVPTLSETLVHRAPSVCTASAKRSSSDRDHGPTWAAEASVLIHRLRQSLLLRPGTFWATSDQAMDPEERCAAVVRQ